jgi:hypothetical protein
VGGRLFPLSERNAQIPFDLDPFVALAGLLVGLVVGLTGMGGGAL